MTTLPQALNFAVNAAPYVVLALLAIMGLAFMLGIIFAIIDEYFK